MGFEVTISSITSGAESYDIYVCDSNQENCVYYTTIEDADLPYTFITPPPLDSLSDVCIKIVDNNGCITNVCSMPVSPSVTPTNTPSPTPGISATPTKTPTNTPTPTPFSINNTTQFIYQYYIGSPPYINWDTVANAAAAEVVICDYWAAFSKGSSGSGSLFTNPLQVGTYVEFSNIGGSPMPSGNYIVGNYPTVEGPTSVNYWVVIDGSGFVTQYTLIDPNC